MSTSRILDMYIVPIVVIYCCYPNRIGGVMVSVLASSTIDHWFEPRSGQTEDYKISIVASPLSSIKEKLQSVEQL